VLALHHGNEHRALRLLAGSPLGCTEAIMLAHGFTYTTLDTLVRDGLATAERREMRAGRQPIKVIWLTITEAGRLALAR
jgi:DNA-binding PadR family transcriptional regulator